MRIGIIAGLGLLVATGVASADTVVFDFGAAGGGASASKVFTVGGIQLTVTAAAPAGAAIQVTQAVGGLGARSGPGDDNNLDSFGPNSEVLFLTITGLPAGVTGLMLDEVDFTNLASGEDARTEFDGVSPLSPPPFSPPDPWLVGNDLTDTERTFFTTLSFAALTAGGNDSFRIRSITLTTVPEPAILALVCTGLALVARRRRR